MGMGWNFFSFEKPKWDAIFGAGSPEAERHLIASAAWDRIDFDDHNIEAPDPETDLEGYLDVICAAAPDPVKKIMKRICADGISYEGLTVSEATLLDNAIVGFFCPEGLETLLEFEYESSDFVHMSVISEMLQKTSSRGRGTILSRIFGGGKSFEPRLLPIMQTGRRIGGGSPDSNGDGFYFILDPDEVKELRHEVEMILDSKPKWKRKDFEVEIREYLLTPLMSIESKRTWLAASWG